MNSEEYTKIVFDRAGLIILDTSTLMRECFQVFMENNKEWLLLNNKRFFVHRAVYTEIAKHLRSGNPKLVEAAMRAVKLMVENGDLFSVDSTELSDEEIDEVFADNILLSELTRRKTDCIQLFIVNDTNLGEDAFDLNKQKSCRGHRIYVCFINPYGELQCSDCVLRANDDKKEDITDKAEAVQQNTVETEVLAVSEPEVAKGKTEPVQEPWKFDLKSGVATGSAIIAAYLIIKGGAALIRNLKTR